MSIKLLAYKNKQKKVTIKKRKINIKNFRYALFAFYMAHTNVAFNYNIGE